MRSFMRNKKGKLTFYNYVVKTLSQMALGLFSSLIIGLILHTIGEQIAVLYGNTPFSQALLDMGAFAMDEKIVGGAIGVAISYSVNAPPLVLFSSLFAGAYGYMVGGPAGAYVTAIIASECGKLIYQKTKIDIIVTPLVTISTAFITGRFIGPKMDEMMTQLGRLINWSTDQQPFIMGILVATFMGFALTAPISSVAIAFMLSLDGLAAGASVIGCSAQMIGFATSSYRENGIGGFIAQGIGTSMLQVSNILKKPIILLPPTMAGILMAPVGTILFEMKNNSTGAGMGTSGFVGQIMTFQTMGFNRSVLTMVLIVHMIGPLVISLVISEWMRKKGYIKFGDMKINYE